MAADPESQRRFKLIPLDQLTPEQRVMADAIRSGPRSSLSGSAAATPGPLGSPFNVWLRSPDIGNLIQQLGAAIRFRSSLPARLNELAIIITARYWTAQYEWHAHCRLALEAGLDPATADAIANGREPQNMKEDEAAIYRFSSELHTQHGVSDATYATALRLFGEQGIMDLIAVNGFYVLVSMALNVDRTPVPGGKLPLPVLGK